LLITYQLSPPETIQEFWFITSLFQAHKILIAICSAMSFIRILYYFIPYHEIGGVLLLSIFRIFEQIFLFILYFIFVSFGFASAFFLLLESDPEYVGVQMAIFQTAFSIVFGVNFPQDWDNTLFSHTVFSGVIFKGLWMVLVVIFLLNFVIAMMNYIYQQLQDNATSEYRWFIAHQVLQFKYSLLPSPLNLIQLVVFLIVGVPAYFVKNKCNLSSKYQSNYKVNIQKRNDMNARLVSYYFCQQKNHKTQYDDVSSSSMDSKE